VAARTAFNLHFIFDDGKAPNRGSPATICYAPPECKAPNIQRRARARDNMRAFYNHSPGLVARNVGQFDDGPNLARCHVFKSAGA